MTYCETIFVGQKRNTWGWVSLALAGLTGH